MSYSFHKYTEKNDLSSQELDRIADSYPKRERPVNPREFAEQIFKVSEIPSEPDAELSDLLADASTQLEDAELSKFLAAQKKFDEPVYVVKTGREIKNDKLRKCLKELPGYIHAAETAGLRYKQAIDLLIHTLESDRLSHSEVDIHILLLARAFKVAEESGIDMGQHVDTLKEIITFGGKPWGPTMEGSLYMIPIALRIGLSPEQAYRTFKKIDDVTSTATGHVTLHFNDALKSMIPAKVDPKLVEEAFELIVDNDGYSAGLYELFKKIMIFGGPSQGISPNELLALFVKRIKTGKEIKLAAAEGEVTKEVTDIPKERYFIENKNSRLEHAGLPYRMVRTLNDGMRDLEKLAVARSPRWEEAAEGMWTFDPETKTWYSFGGQLEMLSMREAMSEGVERIRHNFLPYDLSRLSENPYIFHVHPEEYDIYIAPAKESMAYPELQDEITKFLTATPSGADYGAVGELIKGSEVQVPTRSFISHALGITEFIYPNDPEKLEEMKEKSRAIRDQVMLEFDAEGYVREHGWPVDRTHLVQTMLKALNEKLPEGFSIKLYPTGTDLEKTQAANEVPKDIRENVKNRLVE